MRTWAIHRQDKNDHGLMVAAYRLGAIAYKFGPLDYWINWHGCGEYFVPVEIKDPARENHKDQFTKLQEDFMQTCREADIHFEIWRTLDDVENSRSRAFAKARAG